MKALAERGATSYKLVTNLSASAHLDVGSLDRVQRILNESLPIPAGCWWRDDLDRRLEASFDLKLSYPELFTGTDFCRLLIERSQNDPDAERRGRAIRAYLAAQYRNDKEVRFKQADLANDLLQMFVDVKAWPPAEADTAPADMSRTDLQRLATRLEADADSSLEDGQEDRCGAATLLLNDELQALAPRVVLEAAPGEGKSTALQYICQVHRIRLLDKTSELDSLPASHAVSPVRLPLKLELRDFSRWLANQDEPTKSHDPPETRASLEEFLANHIATLSGGVRFDVADVQAVFSDNHILLALDGLDEVGDLNERDAALESILAGLNRLDAVATAVQVVLTTRPDSLAGPETFPPQGFELLQLCPVGDFLIDLYAKRWMDARRLEPRERQELLTTLETQLNRPHVRDLARNPMQLAILLNLVHRRDRGLPDQRTALYSSYIEIFLDREARKSAEVRKHRDLLLRLHGYLAWLLHCRAEHAEGAGRFTFDELQQVVGRFLNEESYEEDLFKDLFGDVFDRIGALVSREQSTVEFEVQPLREYFAARHLYKTAPYSAPGHSLSGTRPERFDALARDPYWLNVTRFYAGFYDVGELPSLADRLTALHEDFLWGRTSHPRNVASSLLADRTFQQDRRSQARTVNELVEVLKYRRPENVAFSRQARESVQPLPCDCGGDQLVDRAVALLMIEPRADRQIALANLIRSQVGDPFIVHDLWVAGLAELRGSARAAWYRNIRSLGLNPAHLTRGDLGDLSEADLGTVEALLYAEQYGALADDGALERKAIDVILAEPSAGAGGAAYPTTEPLALLSEMFAADHMFLFGGASDLAERLRTSPPGCGDGVRGFVETAARSLAGASDTATGRFVARDEIVELGRSLWGNRPALTALAVVGSVDYDADALTHTHGDLFDDGVSLCGRAMYARRCGDDVRWWLQTLDTATSEEEAALAAALAWTSASESALSEIRDPLLALHDRLTPNSIDWLASVSWRIAALPGIAGPPLSSGFLLDVDAPAWLFAVTAGRVGVQETCNAYEKREGATTADLAGRGIAKWLIEFEFGVLAAGNSERWTGSPARFREWYEALAWWPSARTVQLDHASLERQMPLEIAYEIIDDSEHQPLDLLHSAERCSTLDARRRVESLDEVARRDRWFEG